jgi:thiamine biosynthesis lipoprotein
MATLFEVLLPHGPDNCLPGNQALDLVDELEDQLTVFRDTSEVSLLNQSACSGPVRVESRLFGLLQFAAHLGIATQGAFDIATGALIKTWGFYQRQGRVPTVAERIEAMNRTGMRHVILDSERQTVRYLRAGLEINLGGIGKGYALDRVGEMLRESRGIRSALLHGGASSVLALGAPPSQPAGWTVALKHPWDMERTIGLVNLKNQALGTSAATHQHFEYNGRKLGHLLDPRTGWPAEQIQQVSAIAPSAAEADALSTAFFVLGVEATRRYCETHPGIGAIIVPCGDDAGLVVLNTSLR